MVKDGKYFKNLGNDAYNNGEYHTAIALYKMAMNLKEDCMKDVDDCNKLILYSIAMDCINSKEYTLALKLFKEIEIDYGYDCSQKIAECKSAGEQEARLPYHYKLLGNSYFNKALFYTARFFYDYATKNDVDCKKDIMDCDKYLAHKTGIDYYNFREYLLAIKTFKEIEKKYNFSCEKDIKDCMDAHAKYCYVIGLDYMSKYKYKPAYDNFCEAKKYGKPCDSDIQSAKRELDKKKNSTEAQSVKTDEGKVLPQN